MRALRIKLIEHCRRYNKFLEKKGIKGKNPDYEEFLAE